jgi:hypothetical protein
METTPPAGAPGRDYCGLCRRAFVDGDELTIYLYQVDPRNPHVRWIYGLHLACAGRVRANPSLLRPIEREAKEAYPAFLAALPTAGSA